jgi:hypothetical protein
MLCCSESSLKVRQAVDVTTGITTAEELSALTGTLQCDAPNADLYSFQASLAMDGHGSMHDDSSRGDCVRVACAPIDCKHAIWRGSVIRNTKWVHGLIVYTGMPSVADAHCR